MAWFQDVTGLADDRPATVQAGTVVQGEWLLFPATGRRMRAGRLSLPALGELPRPAGRARATLREVVADVRDLHADPAQAGAVFQVASQFNLLEMIGPDVTPDMGIARYAWDRTQGPACAMACAAGTIWRNYLVPAGDGVGQTASRQIDTLADLGAALGNGDGALWAMRNGNLLPRPGGLARIAAQILPDATNLRALLRVGVQAETEVTLPGAGHTVTQIYASALPVAYARESATAWEPFGRLVLEGAYEATLAAAQASGQRTVYLTRLGGGAFGNPDAWIDDAILTALRRLPGLDLDVALVSHGHSHPRNRALVAGWAAG